MATDDTTDDAVDTTANGAGETSTPLVRFEITTPAARFDPRFLDVGIHPGGGHLWRMASRVGEQGAAAMVLCGDTLDGVEAVTHGLAWRCVAEPELLATALRLAERAAGRPPELVARAKDTLRRGRGARDVAEAAAIELAAQQWSVTRPGYREHLLALRDRGRRGPAR